MLKIDNDIMGMIVVSVVGLVLIFGFINVYLVWYTKEGGIFERMGLSEWYDKIITYIMLPIMILGGRFMYFI